MNVCAKILQWLFRGPRRLLADERGATAIEFGLLAIPFFSIIAAILQTSLIFLSSQVLETAVNDAARTIRTGQAQQVGATAATFRNTICNGLYGLFPDCAGLHIRVVSADRFDDLTYETPISANCVRPCNWTTNDTFTPGGGRRAVLVQVFYKYPVIVQLGAMGMSNLPDGNRLLGTAAVFQSEPF